MSAATITEETLMEAILSRVPGFRPMWEDHLEFWDKDTRMVGNDVAEFAVYVSGLLEQGTRTGELERIFGFAEELMNEADEDVKDQIATNFLENIVNSVGEDAAVTEVFVSLLGPSSLAFCQEWNRFSGGGVPALER